MPEWRIQLFFGLQARRDGRVITRFRTKKTGSLLAYLAFYPHRRHPREALLERFWPGEEREQARLKLRIALSSLRRQLEPPGGIGTVILADRDAIGLNPDAVTTDVAAFEAALRAAKRARSAIERSHWLGAAIDEYRGELLPGYVEDWLIPQRHRLACDYGEALRALAVEREQAGDVREALQLARRAAADDPFNEEVHFELIRLLIEGGRPETALREYEQYAQRLSREMALEPSSELAALIQPSAAGTAARSLQPCPPSEANVAGPTGLIRPLVTASPAPSSPPATATFLLVEVLRPVGVGRESAADGEALTRQLHARLAAEAVRRGGYAVEGDEATWLMRFPHATGALAAALAGQAAAEAMGCLARMAMHTGEIAPEGSHGRITERVGQVLLATHGGQILCTAATAALLRSEGATTGEIQLGDLGSYHLRSRGGEPRLREQLLQVLHHAIRGREFPPVAAEPARVGLLPPSITRFFGRETEIEGLTAQLLAGGARLVTLTGPGGSGKTRLALEVARRLRDRFRGAVWFVPLADLAAGERIAAVVAATLGLPGSVDGEPVEGLVSALREAPTLLLLDNMEHLVEEGAPLVRTLIERAPSLTCLVTSRRPLALPGEREMRVDPLPLPPSIDGEWPRASSSASQPVILTPDELGALQSNPSVALFLDRAQATQADFRLAATNAAAIAAICRRLEGIPLSLELAAARSRMLSPQQMVAQLAHPLDFLVSRRKNGAPRHQALRATLDWSFHLLSPRLQRFFARLSVFRGGFTQAAAAAVGEEPHVLDDLTLLRTTSLLMVEAGGNEARYRLLETLREYGWEQLDLEERARAVRRHAEYYLSLAESSEPRLTGLELAEWLNRLDAEHDNCQAALAWAQSEGAELLGLRLAGALGPYWRRRGHLNEGIRWLTVLLSSADSDTTCLIERSARARALLSVAQMVFDQGDCGRAEGLARQAAALFEAAGEASYLAQALFVQGRAVSGRDPSEAQPFYARTLSLSHELGDRSGMALALTGLGIMAGTLKDSEAQRQSFSRALAIRNELGDPAGTAEALYLLGVAARDSGDGQAALRCYEESLPLARAIGDKLMTGLILQLIGEVAYPLEDWVRAKTCFTESLILNRELGRWGVVARAMVGLGNVTRDHEEPRAARAWYEECLALARQHNLEPALGGSLAGLAHLSRDAGNLELSWSQFSEALRHFHRICVTKATPPGSASAGLADCLEGMALLLQDQAASSRRSAAVSEAAGRVVRLLGAAAAIRSWTPWPRPTRQAAAVTEQCRALLRTRLAGAPFSAAWAEGSGTPLPLVPELLSDRGSLT